jgi:hypothetical protein
LSTHVKLTIRGHQAKGSKKKKMGINQEDTHNYKAGQPWINNEERKLVGKELC